MNWAHFLIGMAVGSGWVIVTGLFAWRVRLFTQRRWGWPR